MGEALGLRNESDGDPFPSGAPHATPRASKLNLETTTLCFP